MVYNCGKSDVSSVVAEHSFHAAGNRMVTSFVADFSSVVCVQILDYIDKRHSGWFGICC
jgi:hypothetical protein